MHHVHPPPRERERRGERDYGPQRKRRNERERRGEEEQRLVHRVGQRLFLHEILDAVSQRLAPSLDHAVGPEPVLDPRRDLPLSQRQQGDAEPCTP